MWGWVIGIIIFLSIVSGGCGSCGSCGSSCNSCNSCGSSSSNSSCSSCGDCGDDDYYDDDYWYEDYSDYKKRYGKITFRIHTVDGEELEISGSSFNFARTNSIKPSRRNPSFNLPLPKPH